MTMSIGWNIIFSWFGAFGHYDGYGLIFFDLDIDVWIWVNGYMDVAWD